MMTILAPVVWPIFAATLALCFAPRTQDDKLRNAAICRDAKAAAAEIAAGADLDKQDRHGKTPLHIAVENGDLRMARLLLSKGANSSIPDMFRSTPLHEAVARPWRCREFAMVDLLLDHGADVNVHPKWHKTPLMASLDGPYGITRTLLERGANPNIRNSEGEETTLQRAAEIPNGAEQERKLTDLLRKYGAKGRFGRFFLHKAATGEKIAFARAVLRYAGKVNEKDVAYGNTPLHWAIICGQSANVKTLLAAKASVNAKNKWGWSPLFYAVRYARTTILADLLRSGADVNLQGTDGRTPLYVATELGNKKVVGLLLRHKAKPNVRCSETGLAPVHVACLQGNRAVLKQLITAGVDVNLPATARTKVVRGGGMTALYCAVRNVHLTTVRDLLANGAKTDVTGTPSPLCEAINSDEVHLVKLLIENGANVEGKDRAGLTALQLAVSLRNAQTVEILIRGGVNVNAADAKQGLHPLYVAAMLGSTQMTSLLLKAGADPDVKTKDGGTAIECAKGRGRTKVLELLRAAKKAKARRGLPRGAPPTTGPRIAPTTGAIAR